MFDNHEDSIIKICDELLKNGERPSASKVREIRGKGSNSTIQPAIDIWWETLFDRISYFSEHPNLSKSVVEVAAKMQKLAYKEAKDEYLEAEADFMGRSSILEDENKQLSATLSEQLLSLKELEANNRSMENELVALRDSNRDLKKDKSLLLLDVNTQKEMIAEVRNQLLEKSSLIASMKSDLTQRNDINKSLESEIVELRKIMDEERSQFQKESLEFSHIISQRNDNQVRLEENITSLKSMSNNKEKLLAKKDAEIQSLNEKYNDSSKTLLTKEHDIIASEINLKSNLERLHHIENELLGVKKDKDYLKSLLNKESDSNKELRFLVEQLRSRNLNN